MEHVDTISTAKCWDGCNVLVADEVGGIFFETSEQSRMS